MKVTISILTHNRVGLLRDLLTDIRRLRGESLAVVVVDNNSSDGTAQFVESKFPEVLLCRMPQNMGVGARNEGISRATGDVVITLDDDVIGIGDKEVASIVRIFENRPNVGAICFKVVDNETGRQCNWCHHYSIEQDGNREFVTDEITEGAVAFRKAAIERSGLYCESFFISHEGADLLVRLLESGYITIYSPEICVRHHTAPEGREDWRRYYYDTRNQIWLAIRNYPVLWAAKYLLRGLTAMLYYSVRDGYTRYWLKGVFDAVRKASEMARHRKPFSARTRAVLEDIAAHRPSLAYTVRRKLFARRIRL